MKRSEQTAHARPYHGAVSYLTPHPRAGLAFAALVALGWLGGCSDLGPGDLPPPPQELIVSDPGPAAGSAPGGGAATAPASSADDEVAYVSLAPSTVATGDTATIRRVGDAGSFVTTMRDGGFDPVPVGAQPGDSIDITVKDAAGGTVLQARLAVAAARPPIVVRTDPPRKKTDVPLNTAIAIVFSEPVAGGTLVTSSVQLFRGTTPVAGSVRLLAGTATAAVFVPSTPLDPNTAYRLEVTRAVQDLEGDALAAGVTMEFTTGQSSTGPAASITLSPDTAFMTGATYQLTATVRDAAGNLLIDQPITWSSDDPAGLTVSSTGLLTALATGPYHVAATVNELTAEVLVIVSGGPAASVAVSPSSATVGAGDTIALTATVRDGAGRLLEYPSVTWTTSDVALATAVADSAAKAGLAFATVTGVTVGTVTITATSGTVSGTASVTIVPPPPVASVTVTPASATLVVQGTMQLSATVQDANGKVLAGRIVTWTSDNPAIATVDANGLVMGVSVGAAAVIATSEGVSDTATISVMVLSFASVTSGTAHTCGLTPSGTAYCWGWNGSGLLGDGSDSNRTMPVPVSGGLHFTALSAGYDLTFGRTTGGTAYWWPAWGVPVTGGLTFSAVSDGEYHACGLTASAAAYCWGQNWAGQLGDGSTTWAQDPVPVTGGLTFSAVTVSWQHTCGLTTNGAAYCWGSNGYGQLGDGSNIDQLSPVAVRGGLAFSMVSTGADHTCGLTTSGAAYCWGLNLYGPLGDGSTNWSSVPVAVTGGLTFSALSSGGSHTCGLTTNGAAYCWGANTGGQLGTGSETGPEQCDGGRVPCSTRPIAVTGGLTFSALSVGLGHTCTVTVASVAYCWGLNGRGQLGNGTTTDSSVPVKVAGQP